MRSERNRRGLPPGGMPLKEALGYMSRALILGSVQELLVPPEYDDACPSFVRNDLVDLETDKRVLSHPLDFLTQCGVAIEKLAVQVNTNRNNVRLVVTGACQASDIRPGKHCAALAFGHLLDYHVKPQTPRCLPPSHATPSCWCGYRRSRAGVCPPRTHKADGGPSSPKRGRHASLWGIALDHRGMRKSCQGVHGKNSERCSLLPTQERAAKRGRSARGTRGIGELETHTA
jgi:hypothetical protein